MSINKIVIIVIVIQLMVSGAVYVRNQIMSAVVPPTKEVKTLHQLIGDPCRTQPQLERCKEK